MKKPVIYMADVYGEISPVLKDRRNELILAGYKDSSIQEYLVQKKEKKTEIELPEAEPVKEEEVIPVKAKPKAKKGGKK